MSKHRDTLTDREIRELQYSIDLGIVTAQKRLVARAKHDGWKLVVCPEGQVVEIEPESIRF